MSREDLVARAKILEQIDRYDDMIAVVKQVVQQNPELSAEERNLLSVAYKNAIGSLRTASRALKSLEKREEAKGSKNIHLLKDFKKKVEGELIRYGNDVISLVDKSILPAVKTTDAEIFFNKLKADYYRYLTECTEGETNRQYANKAGESYKAAYEKAKSDLKTTDPIRLGLALNYSVFFYQVQEDNAQACQISKNAFDDAITDIQQIGEDQYKETTTILQLLKDNLTQWTSQGDDDDS